MIGSELDFGGSEPVAHRRVRRILRKLDPWTVFKVSFVLAGLAGLGFVLVSVMLWAVISRLGLTAALDSAAERVALIGPGESLFKSGGEYMRGMILLSASWMMGVTALATLGSVLYNLLAELVGGVEFTLLQEVPVATAAYSDGAPVRGSD